MNVKLTKSEDLPDWYTIERVEHDGRVWMEPTDYGAKLMCSARICDADVEGTSDEMIAIANAIRGRTSISFRRCSATLVGESYLFDSPRNSQEQATLTLAEADALADSIYDVINKTNQPKFG